MVTQVVKIMGYFSHTKVKLPIKYFEVWLRATLTQ